MKVIPLLLEHDDEDPDCALPLVEGTVSGRAYRFVLDTGAARTHIVGNDHTATLTQRSGAVSSGVFAAHELTSVTLQDVRIGPVHRATVEALLLNPGAGVARNLLGMDVLRDYRCEFRFTARQLVLSATGPTDGHQPLHLDVAAHPYVPARWGNAEASCVWDSGASMTVVDERFRLAHPDLFAPAGSSTGTDATGARVTSATYLMTPVRIGTHQFPAHRVAAVDLSTPNATVTRPMNLILGWTTLGQADWVFDFPAQRWAVAAPLG